MKTKFQTSLNVLLTILLATTPFWAAHLPIDETLTGLGPAFHKSPIPPPRVLRLLGLGERQLAETQALQAEFRASLAPLLEEAGRLHEALVGELEMDDPSPQVVGEVVIALKGVGDAIHDLVAETAEAFEALLTPEQLEKLNRIQNERRRWRDRHELGAVILDR